MPPNTSANLPTGSCLALGEPQCGQLLAFEEISRLQSAHKMRDGKSRCADSPASDATVFSPAKKERRNFPELWRSEAFAITFGAFGESSSRAIAVAGETDCDDFEGLVSGTTVNCLAHVGHWTANPLRASSPTACWVQCGQENFMSATKCEDMRPAS